MPPLASWNMPARAPIAPVKAPRSWPKISDSSSSAGIAPQFTGMNGLSARGDELDACAATSSLPVPLSPMTRTVASVAVTFLMRAVDLLDQRVLPYEERELIHTRSLSDGSANLSPA